MAGFAVNDYPLIPQGAEFWCWAAVCASFSTMNGDSKLPCQIATERPGVQTNCCMEPTGPGCPVELDLGAALNGLGFLAAPPARGSIPGPALLDSLKAGNPVAVQFFADAGWAHVFAITAATEDGVLRVADPAKTTQFPWPYNDLYNGLYDGYTGRWTVTYLTHRKVSSNIPSSPIEALSLTARLAPAEALDGTLEELPLYQLDVDDMAKGASLSAAVKTDLEVAVSKNAARLQSVEEDVRPVAILSRSFNSSIVRIRRMVDVDDLRVLRVPGLRLYALWYATPSGSVVLPMHPLPTAFSHRPYGESLFESLCISESQRHLDKRVNLIESWSSP